MGKVVGLIGSASGKVGNIVYAVSNGIQIARVYQPNITNPKSALQSAQRAKGNLAGRISSLTPATALFGLGANGRARRGAFLSQILRTAVVTQSGSDYNAKVADEDVLFSRGSVPLSVTFSSVTPTANVITITLNGYETAFSPEEYASMATRLVVMVYDATSQELVEVVTRIANKPGQGTGIGTTIPISHPAGYEAVIYAIPMSTDDGSAMAVSTTMATKSDTDIAASLSVNGSAVVFKYGKSVMLTSASYTPA